MKQDSSQAREGATCPEAEDVDSGVVVCGPQDFSSLSSEVLHSGKRLRFQAKGGSMHPFVRNGDLLLVEPADGSTMKLGELAFYRTENGGIAAHRVVGRDSRGGCEFLATKGDAVRGIPHAVACDEVLGRVVAIERQGTTVKLDGGQARAVAVVYVMSYRFARRVCRALGRVASLLRGMATIMG
jgi:signal peptidase I